jgi:hypothetical protein
VSTERILSAQPVDDKLQTELSLRPEATEGVHRPAKSQSDEIDRKLLTTIIERFHGRPAGLNALASSIGEDRGTIEDPRARRIGFGSVPAAQAAWPHCQQIRLRPSRLPHERRADAESTALAGRNHRFTLPGNR